MTIATKETLERIFQARKYRFASRTQIDFPFVSDNPGWLCVNYDPQDGVDTLCHDELREKLIIVCPEIKHAQLCCLTQRHLISTISTTKTFSSVIEVKMKKYLHLISIHERY